MDEARRAPYELGVHDCFKVACEVLKALTGVERWNEFAGYRTKEEAVALILQHGSTFELAFDVFFGSTNVAPAFAQRGDICATRGPDGEKHLGVCLGVDTAFLGPGGLVHMPTLSCLCCWKIG
jgi:hypothetical protein